jgi:hypothetical protein
MSVDPNLQSTDEMASRAPEAATGEGMSSTVQPARKSVFREYAEAIVVAMLLAFAIRVFVVQAFKIPSGSMIPTLLIGDHILVSKLAYGIQWPSDCKFQVTFPPVNCYHRVQVSGGRGEGFHQADRRRPRGHGSDQEQSGVGQRVTAGRQGIHAAY